MPPKSTKKAAAATSTTPLRRSGRLASREGSVASDISETVPELPKTTRRKKKQPSVDPDQNEAGPSISEEAQQQATSEEQVQPSSSTAGERSDEQKQPEGASNQNDRMEQVSEQEQSVPAPVWTLTSIIERVVDGNRKILHKLTQERLIEVVGRMAVQHREMRAEIEQLQEETEQLGHDKAELVRAREARGRRNLRRDFTMQQIMEKSVEKEQAAVVNTAPLSPPQAGLASSEASLEKTTTTEEETSTAAPSGWRSMLTSLGGYIPKPFARKRRADGDVVEPSQKRVRIGGGSEVESDSTPPAWPADTATEAPSQKRKRAGSPARTPGPSARIPGTATSLSTISERTERSNLSEAPEINSAADFPWGPRRQVIHSTPTQAPRPRSVPEMRAAANARRAKTPSAGVFWGGRGSTPLPKLPNADERWEKIQRMRSLERQLEELKKDEDIIEIQQLRRKRVKIDHLPSIPHNLPGDPASTFRVPEYDSDEEMEVLEDVPEMENSFDSIEDDEVPTPRPSFAFPNVAPRPADYHVGQTYKKIAERDFADGLQKNFVQSAEYAFAVGLQKHIASL